MRIQYNFNTLSEWGWGLPCAVPARAFLKADRLAGAAFCPAAGRP